MGPEVFDPQTSRPSEHYYAILLEPPNTMTLYYWTVRILWHYTIGPSEYYDSCTDELPHTKTKYCWNVCILWHYAIGPSEYYNTLLLDRPNTMTLCYWSIRKPWHNTIVPYGYYDTLLLDLSVYYDLYTIEPFQCYYPTLLDQLSVSSTHLTSYLHRRLVLIIRWLE